MAAQPVTREAFVELLSDYVRDALQQRLRDKHSSHYALCVRVRAPRARAFTARSLLTRRAANAAQAAHEL